MQDMVRRVLGATPPGLLRLGEAFNSRGFGLRIVGGAVRDAAAGLAPKDIDLCTDAAPSEQEAVYEAAGLRCIPTGLKHGTWTVLLDGEPVEVTSLRVDLQTDGRHADVEWTRSWEADLGRRDLTINAMSMTLDGVVFDPFGGMDDLYEGRVRFVGDAESRMREDYLRILRWVRFEGRFGGRRADLDAMKAAVACKGGLEKISRERVWSEFKRIASGPRGAEMMLLCVTLGIDEPCGLQVKPQRFSMYYDSGLRDPVALMTVSVPDVASLAEQWKWSREERDTAVWLKERLQTYGLDPRRMVAADGQRRDRVSLLMRMQGRPEEGEAILGWQVPTFPVRGYDVEGMGVPRGPEVGAALARMRERWTQSGYEADAETLLDAERALLDSNTPGGMRP